MSSSIKSSVASSRSTAAPSSALSAGARKVKVKVAPGSHIKDFAAVHSPNNRAEPLASQVPARSKATRTASDPTSLKSRAYTKAPIVATSEGCATATTARKEATRKTLPTRRTTPGEEPASQRDDDFNVFARPVLRSQPRVSHEQSARRISALRLPAQSTEPRLASVSPAKVVKSVKQNTVIKESPLPAPDLEQRLSIQRMKDDAQTILKQRHASLYAVVEQIAAARRATEAVGQDIEKLRLFGQGFDMAQIEGIDAQAVVALASWGVAVQTESEEDRVVSTEFAPSNDSALREESAREDMTPVKDTASPVVSVEEEEEDLFGDAEADQLASIEEPKTTSANGPPPELSFSPKPQPIKPSRKPRPTSRAFMKPRPKRHSGTTTTPTPQPIQRDLLKDTKVNIIDNEAALKVGAAVDEIIEMEAPANKRKVQTKTKGDAAPSAAKGAGTKSRFSLDNDGEVRWRKKSKSVACGKCKRAVGLEQPNKRSAVEGRSFAPMRARRAMELPTTIELDSSPALPPAAQFFTS